MSWRRRLKEAEEREALEKRDAQCEPLWRVREREEWERLGWVEVCPCGGQRAEAAGMPRRHTNSKGRGRGARGGAQSREEKAKRRLQKENPRRCLGDEYVSRPAWNPA